MAIIYDFPTNYEEKLKKVDDLLEKNYIDQAICVLEDWVENVSRMSGEGEKEIRKKLLNCYLLKKEYDSCEVIVLQLKQLGCLDLTIAAYDIVVSLLQNQKQVAERKQVEYQQQLQLSKFACKNLVELVFQLKTFYEDEWLRHVDKKFKALVEAKSFEKILIALSDLQEVEAEYFTFYQDSLMQFFETEQLQILKTMLFELVSQKGLALEVEFVDGEESKKLCTTLESLESFYEEIHFAKKELLSLGLAEVTTLLLEQQIMMFYQFVFPFFEKIDRNVVLQELGENFGEMILENFEKEEFVMSIDSTKKGDTVRKINQYMLSLSLLI